jgi:hypothetical protein
MSRWCDQSIHDERIPHFPVALYEVAVLFGTLVAETILASVRVRARKQAGHMDASDLIKALPNIARRGPSTYGKSEPPVSDWNHFRSSVPSGMMQ